MLLLPVPFELCMCPDKCFFWLKTWGGKKAYRLHSTSDPDL